MIKEIENNDLFFGRAESEILLNNVFAFRAQIYKNESPYLLKNNQSANPGEEIYDQYSYNFYVANHLGIIGSCRCTPFFNDQWEISEKVLDINLNNYFNPDLYLQFNRLLIHPNFRNNNVHEILFFHVCSWIVNHTQYRKYFSVCRPALVKIYQHYNAQLVLKEPIKILDRKFSDYFLIEGSAEELIESIVKKRPELSTIHS